MSDMEASSRQETSDGSPALSPVPSLPFSSAPASSPVQVQLHREQPGPQGFIITISDHTAPQGPQFGSASSVLDGIGDLGTSQAEIEEDDVPTLHPPPNSDVGFGVRRRPTDSRRPAGSPLGRCPSYKPTAVELEAAKALEKQLEELRTQEQTLLTQGDSVMSSLSVNSQILVGVGMTFKSIFPDNHHLQTSSCGKVVLTAASVTSFSFVLGYVLALTLAVHKLRKLAKLAKHLRTRRKNIQGDSLEFLMDFMNRGIHPPPSSPSSLMPRSLYEIAVSRARTNVDANTKSLALSFGKRIKSLIEDPSIVSKSGSDYTWGLIVFTFLAGLYGIGYPLLSAYLRCREHV